METKIPQTKNEVFAQLDAMLSEEDKNAIINAKIFFKFSRIDFIICNYYTTRVIIRPSFARLSPLRQV